MLDLTPTPRARLAVDRPEPGLSTRLSVLLEGLLHRWLATSRSTWLATFVLCGLIYASTAHWYGITNIDTVAAAWPGWELVHHGTLFLESDPSLPAIPWFQPHHGHVVSDRLPGVIFIGVPAPYKALTLIW